MSCPAGSVGNRERTGAGASQRGTSEERSAPRERTGDAMSSLFDQPAEETGGVAPGAPRPVRIRPRSLDEVVGHQHLPGTRAPMRGLVDDDEPISVVLHGPP